MLSQENPARLWAAVALAAVALGLSQTATPQVRLERDTNGLPLITNSGGSSADEPASRKSKGTGSVPALSSQERREVETKLRGACLRHGLDYGLVASLVRAESGFRHYTLSHKGAIGLMQLMPATGRRFGVKDPWDLDQNIEGGTAFLEFLQGQFSGDIPLMLAAYNAGENNVLKYKRKIPPFAETVRYVFAILAEYGKPHLVSQAKASLAKPGDYDRFYVPRKNWKPRTRTFYMYTDESGVRTIVDSPPTGFQLIPIVYKDE